MDNFGGNNSSGPVGDPFTKFWMDCMAKMGGAGFAPPATPSSEEAVKQMRRAFLDAWAQHCEEFMRSPTFLEGMKRAMDSSLAFREQLNEFMTRALHEGQFPARSDTDSILVVLRSLEDRVLDRLDRIEKRVNGLEETRGGSLVGERSTAVPEPAAAGGAAPTAARRSKGGTR